LKISRLKIPKTQISDSAQQTMEHNREDHAGLNHSGYMGGTHNALENARISGVFADKETAERVYDAIRDRGYENNEIDLAMSDKTRSKFYDNMEGENSDSDMGDRAMEGAGVGSALGGTIGAIVGAVAAIGTSLLLPGLGLVIAGPIAAALAGAGAGGLSGGLLGALVGSGIPEDEAADFENRIKEGGTAITVTPHDAADASFLRSLFRQNSSGRVFDSHLSTKDADYSAGHYYSGRDTTRDSSMNSGTSMGMENSTMDRSMDRGMEGQSSPQNDRMVTGI
jgi:hypothetical protein